MAYTGDTEASTQEQDMSDNPKPSPSAGSVDEKTLDDFFAKMLVKVKEFREWQLPDYRCVTDIEGGGVRLKQVSRGRR